MESVDDYHSPPTSPSIRRFGPACIAICLVMTSRRQNEDGGYEFARPALRCQSVAETALTRTKDLVANQTDSFERYKVRGDVA
jgi:hypothetical protein